MADEQLQEFQGQEISVSELQKTLEQAAEAAQSADAADVTGIKIQMLAMAKDVLERNAALQWEQDKTRGLTITVDEIISQAQKLMAFVLE